MTAVKCPFAGDELTGQRIPKGNGNPFPYLRLGNP